MAEITCGIYKITSPSKRIYIGQSINILRRFKEYQNNSIKIKNQTKLYNSLQKYGVENHTFEIIEECSEEDLNCRERYWQEFYDVLNGGLNCMLQECGSIRAIYSKETRATLSAQRMGCNNSFYGKTHSEETKKLQSEVKKGKVMDVSTKEKIKLSLEGRVFSKEHREKLSIAGKGRKHTEESKLKMSESSKGIVVSDETRMKLSISISGKMSKGNHPSAKLVLCTTTGIFYECIEDASDTVNMKSGTLRAMLSGRNKNKTFFILV